MKSIIKDVCQITLALLLTGSMVYANAPTAQVVKNDTVAVISTESKAPEPKVVQVPVEQPKPAETAPTQPVEPAPEVVPPAPVTDWQSTYPGNQTEWLIASGIPQEYWRAVDYIVSRESSWRPCAYYPSTNDCSAQPVNACGLVMQNPCGKINGDWRDPVAALKWADSYVNQRYGGWPGAMAYWQAHGNY